MPDEPIARRRRLPGPTSSSPTMVMTSSDSSTVASRSRAVAVSTSSGFCSTPVPLTIQPAGHVDAHVEAAEVVVELRRAEIEARIPAAQVVVLRDAREPLRRLEQPVVAALRHAMAAAAGPPGSFVCQSISSVAVRLRGDRLGERDARDGLVEAGH